MVPLSLNTTWLKKDMFGTELSEQQTTSEKAKIPVKLMKALGTPQEELPFKLDVSVSLEVTGQALRLRQQKGKCP